MRLAYGNELGSGQEAERSEPASYSRSGNPPPFMPQRQRSAAPSTRGPDRSAEDMGGWNTRDEPGSEADIFNYAAQD
jgi:hypothetical protein